MSLKRFFNRRLAGLLLCVLCCAACAALRPAGGPRHIAVLPLVNMSGQPAPAKEMRRELMGRFAGKGVAVLDDAILEGFMARHRVRNVDGIDSATARALRRETGTDSVVITTLERYGEADPPVIAMTSRLVSTGETPVILWMETLSLSGGDAPGLLGLGLIKDIARLRNMAYDRLDESFEKYLEGKEDKGGRGGTRLFRPKTVYSSPFLQPGRKYSVAVAPFLNTSGRNNADAFLALHFISRLTKEGSFTVIDPGSVREKLLFLRFIMQDGLSLRQADLIHDTLQADLILAGKVVEYEESAGAPWVEFNALVFERSRKKVVWSSWSFNRGDEGVYFFDWGRITTAGELAAKMTRAVVRGMSRQGMMADGQATEARPAKGPWSLD